MGVEFQFYRINKSGRWTLVVAAWQGECTCYHRTVHFKIVLNGKFYVVYIFPQCLTRQEEVHMPQTMHPELYKKGLPVGDLCSFLLI